MATILFGIPAVYVFLLLLVPRGWALHELLHLPFFWIKMWRNRPEGLSYKKISYGPHRHQYFLYLEPSGGRKNLNTLVLYFHGGGWRFGSPEAFKNNAQVFLDKGLPVVMPSLRRIGRYSFVDLRQDLDAILRKLALLRQSAETSPTKLIVGGMSSGGHLAAHLIFNTERLSRSGWQASDIAGAFFFAAPLDLDRMPPSPLVFLLAGSPGQGSYRRANPIHLLSQPCFIPLYFCHGDRDGLVPLACTDSFIAKIRPKQRASLKQLTLPFGTHLDAASWGHSENNARKSLLLWLEGL